MKKAIAALTLLIFTSGCAQLMANLRRDLDDSEMQDGPTVGGVWPEAGYLSEEGFAEPDRYAAVGHTERAPASEAAEEPESVGPRWSGRGSREETRGNQYRDFTGKGRTPAAEQSIYHDADDLKKSRRTTRRDFVDESQTDGSLWAGDGQTNFFFSKNKIRGEGDIVNVKVGDELLRDTALELKRGLSDRERDLELTEAQLRLGGKGATPGDKNKDAVATSAASAARAPAGDTKSEKASKADAEEQQATYSDIDVSQNMGFKSGDLVLAEVVQRYPNGNYKIRGTKKISYRGTQRLMTLVAVVKGADINEEDQVDSGKLYEYRLEVVR